MTSRWARPYVLTRGRGRGRYRLEVHTEAWASHDAAARTLTGQARELYEGACHGPITVAALSSLTKIPLGVTRVLLSDLIQEGLVRTPPQTDGEQFDSVLLERVLDGLHRL